MKFPECEVERSSKLKVSVVIPSWNGADLLRTCLNSLREQSVRPDEIIVVDDGSTDHTEEVISAFSEVTGIRHEEQGGFCKAVNTGLNAARHPWVFLINNDITFERDCLKLLLAETDQRPDAGMFTPLILWQDEPDRIYAAGDRQKRNGRPESIGFRELRSDAVLQADVFGVTAAVALYRREIFERVGLLDEGYNIYFSDSDLSFRARLAGFGARMVQEACAYHVGSASLRGRTLKRTVQCYQNHLRLVLKCMPAKLILQYAPAIMRERAHQAFRVFSEARCEGGAVYAAKISFGAWMELMVALPEILRQRRWVQRKGTMSATELARLLED